MTLKGTIDSLTKLAEKVDSILGKIKWYGIAMTFVLSLSHYSACKDKAVLQDKVNQLVKTVKK